MMTSTWCTVLATLTLSMGCGAKSGLFSDDGAVGTGSGGSACSPVALTTELGGSALVVDEMYVYSVVPSSTDYGSIVRVAKTGGEIATLADGVYQPGPLAVDATHLYFAAGFHVRRMAKDGTGLTTIASAQPCPNGIVLDDTSVYWSNCEGTIMSAPKAGGSSVTLATTVDEGAQFMAASDAALFWSTNAGHVRSVAKSGGPSTLIVDDDSHARQIAVLGDRVFWADDAFGQWALKGAALDGSDRMIVATISDQLPLGLSAGGGEVYVGFDFPSPEAATGSIVEVSKAGGAVRVVADGQRHPWSLGLDDNCVYWLSAGSIMRAPR